MLFEYVSGVFVGVHTTEAPGDEEWLAHCRNLERERAAVLGVVVFTKGGGPSTAQRRQMRVAMHDSRAPLTAILTSSALVRGIITSLNWFADNRLQAFEPNDLAGAVRYLASEGAPIDGQRIAQTLISLAQRLTVELPASIHTQAGSGARPTGT